MNIDMGLYDSATGEPLKSIKSLDVVTLKGERAQLLFTRSKRGRIVQVRSGSVRSHYFLDEDYSHKRMDEDSARFGFPPGDLYLTAMRHAPPINAKCGDGFVQYRRKQIAELRPWAPGDSMSGVSVSDVDSAAGSPKEGDMIARNPANHDDKWLVAAKYFADNFEPVS